MINRGMRITCIEDIKVISSRINKTINL